MRIFSTEEIDYCLFNSDKSAERFAVRFAAREALYKGISQHDEYYRIPFLTLCSSVIISKKPSGAPEIKIKEESELFLYFTNHNFPTIVLSLSHQKDYAVATVLLYSND